MTKNSKRQQCGDCDHGIKVADANNLGSTALTCFLNPPQVLVVTKGNNGTVLNIRPQVRPEDLCCVHFAPKAQMLV